MAARRKKVDKPAQDAPAVDPQPDTPPEASEKRPKPKGLDELQRNADEATDRGYIGHSPEPAPNAAFTLATGPDAPPLVPDSRTQVQQHSA